MPEAATFEPGASEPATAKPGTPEAGESQARRREDRGGSVDADGAVRYAVVVPSVGRPSLQRLLDTLASQEGPHAETVVVVDDRRGTVEPLTPGLPLPGVRLLVVRGHGRGPAAARNLGWRVAARSGVEWIAFLDDDVELPAGWTGGLQRDLAALTDRDAATQGRIRVPLPADRRPTDWERNTAGLMHADWATADMAYRVAALEAVDGFDERFPRAYREDADLALRVRDAGWTLRHGTRRIDHPVRPADAWVSHRVQAGNADDALMRRLHGPQWRQRADAPGGGFGWHIGTAAALGVTALGAAIVLDGLAGGTITRLTARSWSRRRSLRTTTALLSAPALALTSGSGASLTDARRSVTRTGLVLAAAGAAGWATLTGRFLRLRMAPGPRPGEPGYRDELTRMAATSATIPVAAVVHHVRGIVRHRSTGPWPVRPQAVLFDRDGTLVRDVPYNGDPAKVELMPGAAEAVARVRAAGLAVGLVSNQSGVARGLINPEQVDAVNARVAELVGGFDTVQVCPHGPDDGCPCRKPAPGMVRAAAAALGVDPAACVVVGDIGADVEAAQAAGARSILVPTAVTRPEEVAAAPVVASTVLAAVDRVLARRDGLASPSHPGGPAGAGDGNRIGGRVGGDAGREVVGQVVGQVADPEDARVSR